MDFRSIDCVFPRNVLRFVPQLPFAICHYKKSEKQFIPLSISIIITI